MHSPELKRFMTLCQGLDWPCKNSFTSTRSVFPKSLVFFGSPWILTRGGIAGQPYILIMLSRQKHDHDWLQERGLCMAVINPVYGLSCRIGLACSALQLRHMPYTFWKLHLLFMFCHVLFCTHTHVISLSHYYRKNCAHLDHNLPSYFAVCIGDYNKLDWARSDQGI